MSDKSSGVYVIDEDYNIVSCNQTILELYPQLRKGRKCYQCLMNLDEPCPPCPVAGKIMGPQTYLDPIRGIYETVDAVDMVLEDGRAGHALVVSTVGDRETISARLPQTSDGLNRLLQHEYYDSLTDGFSRKGFIRETERLFERADPCDYAMLMVDLRNFKAINDVFGIPCGDQILQYVYKVFTESWIKPVVSARIESDWFIFLVRKQVLQDGHLQELLNLQWSSEARSVQLHLRCGLYPIDAPGEPVSKMVDWTILAKEMADQRQTGNLAVFDTDMRETYVNRAEIMSSFQSSMKNHEMKVFFQPIVRCRDERICSAEALARWEHPQKGMIPPGDFIPALEKNGLISQLDHYILEQVADFQRSMMKEGLSSVPVSINLSRQDFYNDSLMGEIFRYGKEGELSRAHINYEVTETSMAVLKESCAYYLAQFRKNGARILLDDFGTGFSALGMLGNYPLDVIKIDKSFVERIETQPTVRSIIASTIRMCHDIGLLVVAEGVENQAQRDFLRENYCDYIQGYYYFRPMGREDFRTLLAAHQGDFVECGKADDRHFPKNVDLENLIDLVNHSGLFIQVCHPEDYTMVFANEMTRNISGHPEVPYEGEKCYQYMLGLDAPCGHCPMRKMGDANEKEIETDDGSHVFRLKARFTWWNGQKVFIEYGQEITDTKEAQNRYTSQLRSILEAIPDGQGVFHMDLTADKWISSGGHAENARRMQNMKNVDDLIQEIASFVPSKEGQQHFFEVFCRQAQLSAYDAGRHQIILETESYYDDRSVRWSRIITQLIDNPSNGHVESILYGVDISGEVKHVEELELERLQGRQEKEKLQKQVREAMALYSKADHDRRYDFLTGVYSRLSLYDYLEDAQKEAVLPAAAIMVDLDNFKKVNDQYGHAAGDECLRAVGKALLQFGIDNGIDFYRYGGDEFVGLIKDQDADVYTMTKKLESEIQRMKVRSGSSTIRLTASIGGTKGESSFREMIEKADAAMYTAKNRGKNQVACTAGCARS